MLNLRSGAGLAHDGGSNNQSYHSRGMQDERHTQEQPRHHETRSANLRSSASLNPVPVAIVSPGLSSPSRGALGQSSKVHPSQSERLSLPGESLPKKEGNPGDKPEWHSKKYPEADAAMFHTLGFGNGREQGAAREKNKEPDAVPLIVPSTPSGMQEDKNGHSKFLFDPMSNFFRFWDILTTILLVFTATVTPFEVSFLDGGWGVLFVLNRFVDFCFVTDMMLQFFLPYKAPDMSWVYNHWKIVLHYASTWFAVDLVSVVPFDMADLLITSDATSGSGSSPISSLRALRIIRLFRLVKLLRMLRAGRMFKRWESSFAVDYARLSLAKFLITVLMIAHWLACSWHLVLALEGRDDQVLPDAEAAYDLNTSSWLSAYEYISRSPSHASRYIVSLYWAIATLSTLGYGDVVPTTDGERVFVVVSTIAGASVYAYMVGAVCGIITSMDENQSRFYRQMDHLNSFMNTKKFPFELRVRLREYMRFRSNHSFLEAWHSIIGSLSKELQGRVSEHLHAKALHSVSMFQGASQDFHIAIALALVPETYSKGEYIFQRGSVSKEMYIVEKGIVMVDGRIKSSFMVFGEDMVFRERPRMYAAVTLSHTIVHLLTIESLEIVLRDHPLTARHIHRLVVRKIFRDNVISYARAVRAALKNNSQGKELETLFSAEHLPMLYDHKLTALQQDDPEQVKLIGKAVTVVQRYMRGRTARNLRKSLEDRVRNLPLAMQVLEAVLDRMGMAEYVPIFEREGLDICSAMHLASSDLRMAGIRLSDSVYILNWLRQGTKTIEKLSRHKASLFRQRGLIVDSETWEYIKWTWKGDAALGGSLNSSLGGPNEMTQLQRQITIRVQQRSKVALQAMHAAKAGARFDPNASGGPIQTFIPTADVRSGVPEGPVRRIASQRARGTRD